jgi:hypothetical protein
MKSLEIEKKSVAPLFMNMKVGDSEIYPSIQRLSLESTRFRLQGQFPPIKFSIIKLDSYNIKVTRIA